MNPHISPLLRAVGLALVAASLLAAPAQAEKPDWAGGGKGGDKHERQERQGKGRDKGDRQEARPNERHDRQERQQAQLQPSIGVYFGSPQRDVLRDYYGSQFRTGNCPPGLAKKNNGCMPPGQAKKWAVGRRLPSDVVYYPLPHEVVVRLGVPPAGYKYVRVAADILLIAVGTSMVIDAIEDLSRF